MGLSKSTNQGFALLIVLQKGNHNGELRGRGLEDIQKRNPRLLVLENLFIKIQLKAEKKTTVGTPDLKEREGGLGSMFGYANERESNC